MDQLLALFPLGATVLFPGAQISLHIFEERYRLMISRCISLKEPFGIVLIREGQEVGGTAEPYEVGTIAHITNAIRFDDGEMFITVEGRSRFQIQRTVQDTPYLVAMVQPLEDQVGPEHRIQAAQLRELYERYRDTVAHATGIAQSLDDLPDDPIAMAYQLSAQIQVPHLSKQQLLEADLETRLDALISALSDELRLLPPPSDRPIMPGNSWSLN
ncbi:MAG TPA: LON peptidase substrate-binding domain-containing protein [Herpetosiphonaceae bacterium]|nr:LON peptidase substrate-binding domain-containing protein [Herpetosiphonaceae bacterium]